MENVFPPEPTPRRRTAAARALVTMVGALLVGALLCADSLTITAQRQDYGWQRSLALTVMHPVQDLSHVTGLDRPRSWLVDLTGRKKPPTRDTIQLVTVAPTTTAPARTAPTGGTPPSRPPPPPPTTAAPARRTPTDEDPLRIWVGGDSLSGNLGDAVTKVLDGTPATVHKDVRVGSGLARPERTNWAGELPGALADVDAEVAILALGGNDDQPLQVPGRAWRLGSDRWRIEYQLRVAQVLQAASAPGRTIIWVGLPAVEPDRLEQTRRVMNDVARLEAEARPDVEFFDPSVVLTPDGRYRQYDGTTKLREGDGVHPTHAGAERVATALIEVFAGPRHLR